MSYQGFLADRVMQERKVVYIERSLSQAAAKRDAILGNDVQDKERIDAVSEAL